MKNVIKIDFLSFTLKPEVHSSSEMFVITKWTNQVLSCKAIFIKINKMHTTILARVIDEFLKNLEKCDIEEMRTKSTLVKISSVRCFLKSATPVYYQLHLNLI